MAGSFEVHSLLHNRLWEVFRSDSAHFEEFSSGENWTRPLPFNDMLFAVYSFTIHYCFSTNGLFSFFSSASNLLSEYPQFSESLFCATLWAATRALNTEKPSDHELWLVIITYVLFCWLTAQCSWDIKPEILRICCAVPQFFCFFKQ